MRKNDSDLAWRKWGKEDPYFGVISDPKFLISNLNDESLTEFFVSGERHVEHIYDSIRSNGRPSFRADRVLDYGCGVGRLVIPFALHSQTVVGVDVSPGMLEQAQENCERHSVKNARLLHADDLESLAPRSFDLVHSYIVFQHIPVSRGERIIEKLITLIDEGGVGAIHLTYSDSRSVLHQTVSALRKRSSLVHGILNVVQGVKFSRPLMQMNSYSINRVFDILID